MFDQYKTTRIEELIQRERGLMARADQLRDELTRFCTRAVAARKEIEQLQAGLDLSPTREMPIDWHDESELEFAGDDEFQFTHVANSSPQISPFSRNISLVTF